MQRRKLIDLLANKLLKAGLASSEILAARSSIDRAIEGDEPAWDASHPSFGMVLLNQSSRSQGATSAKPGNLRFNLGRCVEMLTDVIAGVIDAGPVSTGIALARFIRAMLTIFDIELSPNESLMLYCMSLDHEKGKASTSRGLLAQMNRELKRDRKKALKAPEIDTLLSDLKEKGCVASTGRGQKSWKLAEMVLVAS